MDLFLKKDLTKEELLVVRVLTILGMKKVPADKQQKILTGPDNQYLFPLTPSQEVLRSLLPEGQLPTDVAAGRPRLLRQRRLLHGGYSRQDQAQVRPRDEAQGRRNQRRRCRPGDRCARSQPHHSRNAPHALPGNRSNEPCRRSTCLCSATQPTRWAGPTSSRRT